MTVGDMLRRMTIERAPSERFFDSCGGIAASRPAAREIVNFDFEHAGVQHWVQVAARFGIL